MGWGGGAETANHSSALAQSTQCRQTHTKSCHTLLREQTSHSNNNKDSWSALLKTRPSPVGVWVMVETMQSLIAWNKTHDIQADVMIIESKCSTLHETKPRYRLFITSLVTTSICGHKTFFRDFQRPLLTADIFLGLWFLRTYPRSTRKTVTYIPSATSLDTQ